MVPTTVPEATRRLEDLKKIVGFDWMGRSGY
jgi:hypothetical protein